MYIKRISLITFFSTLSTFAEPIANIPKTFAIKATNCPAKYRDTKKKNSKFATYSTTLPMGAEATNLKRIKADKNIILLKFAKISKLSNLEFLVDYACLADLKSKKVVRTEAPSKAKTPEATASPSPKGSRLRYVVDGMFIRERTNFLETANARNEPLFNDMTLASLGMEYESDMGRWIGAFHYYGAQLTLLGGLASVSNADATPYTTVNQSGAFVFGMQLTPVYKLLWGNTQSFQYGLQFGLPLIYRYQPFGTSSTGTISAKTLAFLWGTSSDLYLKFGPSFSIQIGYGFLSADPLSPIFKGGVGLNF